MGLISRHRRIWLLLALPFLFMPALANIFGIARPTEEDAPIHTPQSTAEWLSLPRAVDAWLNGNFGFRAAMLRGNSQLRFALHSPTTSRAAYGENGWLYLTDDAVFQQSMGLRMRVPLVTQLADIAGRLQAELGMRGARVVVAVPPNSQSIKRETLPRWARVDGVRTEYDVLRDALAERKIAFADLRTLLREEETRAEVYLKTDTHWNNHGALVAFNEVMRAAGRAGWTVDPSRVETGMEDVKENGLARMIGLEGVLFDRQPVIDLTSYAPTPYRIENLADRTEQPTYVATSEGNAGGPTVMVIGDSFTRYYFREFLMLKASRLIWTHHDQCAFDWALVERYKPDLLILAPTERYGLCAPGRAPRNEPALR
ncbi:hypothetical protein F2P47_07350 [Parvibaculum sedimenti]|uniref:AlgX/AlgJ SGNH hydrolase-like domain-containing protein n=1 Tax=Parvibaculum sedimenti TaxID=2608632 RepID=A0A6N6VJ01_9HYPH|nr:hypothetical protein [Parvibaculum sedimenti]KAB7740851.1 hypothetical protein F2P47_07350 [Parvibaculum sedimenti]